MPRTKAPAWTSQEIAVLREIYPTEGLGGVADLLSDRSWHSIHQKAFKLGIRCELVTYAPKARLQGDRLEQAIRMREDQNWSFARIAAELGGISEAGVCNAVLNALCTRKGFRPAERDGKGRLLPEGLARLRVLLKKGFKGVDIQLRLALSAGRVAEERRRYNRELKANGKALLPPPGGGEAYSGVKVPRSKVREIEEALMQGLGTRKVSERTGASKTTITRARNRLIRRLGRKGECLPGCDRSGKRLRVVDHFHAIPDHARAEFRRLLIDRRMSARRAGLHAGIGGSNAHRMYQAIVAEYAGRGEQLPPTRRAPSIGPDRQALLDEDAIYPKGRAGMAAFRQHAAEAGYLTARRKLRDDHAEVIAAEQAQRAREAEAARQEALRPRTFEEKLALVASGKAQLVPAFHPRRVAPDMTLGGVATGAL